MGKKTEKERYDELIRYMINMGMKWYTALGRKICKSVIEFPVGRGYSCQYTRGYSIIAEADQTLPTATKDLRGRLISLGRALKAESKRVSSQMVINQEVLTLLSNYGAPGFTPGGEFFKSQFRVNLTPPELQQSLHTGMEIPEPHHTEPQPGTPLRTFLMQFFPRPGAEMTRKELVQRMAQESAKGVNALVTGGDMIKLFDRDWMSQSGLDITNEMRAIVRRA